VVATWAAELSQAPPARKLPFIFLANDIAQNSRRRGTEFTDAFAKALPGAMRHVAKHGGAEAARALRRLAAVWEERRVFGSGRTMRELKDAVEEGAAAGGAGAEATARAAATAAEEDAAAARAAGCVGAAAEAVATAAGAAVGTAAAVAAALAAAGDATGAADAAASSLPAASAHAAALADVAKAQEALLTALRSALTLQARAHSARTHAPALAC
jgi:regulator of Ty1 transposition protein 103